ncbi:cytochrome c oxidase subunit 7A, mitochondrial [Zootermopsis nevadensis]|uniref:Putative cytochrome c oxidase polypeptide 7A1, mitochondrial n=1 Tax=Zootermopsis nevadensis TaxID=136037 RepID=A0A067R334_ZOONE|nr:cytochrome c oxidase subunit 7A, mitochondrial [Zootermopsis nevadensis]KDR17513.1 putative cytochrome c oxidase polypeptide 7A1, mitochondrial [Zootermopsis nevadensis]
MNSAKKLLQLGQLSARQFCTSQAHMSAGRKVADYSKLKAKQAKFQVNDGKLIHLKGGAIDRLLYQLTVAICVIGVGLSGKFLYELSFPKKA